MATLPAQYPGVTLLGSSPSKQKGVLDFKCTKIISPKDHTINLKKKKKKRLRNYCFDFYLVFFEQVKY